MFTFSPARWLATLPVLVALAAAAQTGGEAQPTAQVEAAPALSFQSAMEGYKPFTDGSSVPWRQANETVHQRGGWQAYAKEASADAEGERSPPGAHGAHATPMPPAAPAKEKP
jgi:hypothetical protein